MRADFHVLLDACVMANQGVCDLLLSLAERPHLEPFSIVAVHPDDYLVTLYELEPKQVIAVAGEIAGRRRMEIEDVLIRLGSVIPKFSSLILQDLLK